MVSRLRGNDSSGVGWQFRKLTDLCGCVFRKRATSSPVHLLKTRPVESVHFTSTTVRLNSGMQELVP